MTEKEPKDRYDVVVVGGGPAGLAAAIYTARQGLSTAIIAGELGGQAQWASHVENYLGFELIAGSELADRFRAHARGFDIDTFEGRYADAVIPSDGSFEVHSREGLQLRGRTVIIASGRAPVRLSVPGEKELVGRGVSYCAYCDAAFFRGRPVAVVGPGESAAEAALQLAALDASVILVSEQELRAPQALLEEARGRPARGDAHGPAGQEDRGRRPRHRPGGAGRRGEGAESCPWTRCSSRPARSPPGSSPAASCGSTTRERWRSTAT